MLRKQHPRFICVVMEVDPAGLSGQTDGGTDGQTEGRLIDQTASLLLIYSDRKSITCLPLISPPLVFPAAPPSPLFRLASSCPGDSPMQMRGLWGGWGRRFRAGFHLWKSQSPACRSAST